MPKGPKGEKRPADTIGNAMKAMRNTNGKEVDEKIDDGKDAAAVSLARHGRVDGGQDQIVFVEQRAQVSSLVASRGSRVSSVKSRSRKVYCPATVVKPMVPLRTCGHSNFYKDYYY